MVAMETSNFAVLENVFNAFSPLGFASVKLDFICVETRILKVSANLYLSL